MLKKYTLIGFLVLCSCGSDGGYYSGNYDDDNYWSRRGRYGRNHRHDDHHDGHGHQHGGNEHHGGHGHSGGGGHHGGGGSGKH